ncbi:hypothetical protein MBVR141_0263 [Mycoplasmopsis bovirhinis]|uniref:MGA_1079 family surface serine endopeptidase n=1 Tax=Mycoplasmopsis bovirhinis TaxID=29553 RepID=UPI000BB9D061|nr:hypothetical protein [Mycoplasmopsis bovirhinis]BBA22205.1 hypothetical protein MBVR141_0263 [Mycoplasmopsis bovirhinis]
MQKIKKFSLSLASLTTIPFVALSCSNEGQKPAPTPNNNVNITKVNNFLNSVNNSYVEILKSNVKNYQSNDFNETKADLLIEFVTEYLAILNTKIQSLYSTIDFKPTNFEIIKTKIDEYDKFINTLNNNFDKLTPEFLAQIRKTKKEISDYNSEILAKNKELDDFILAAQKIKLNNSKVRSLLQNNISKLFNLKTTINNPLELVQNVDKNLSKLQDVSDFVAENQNQELQTKINQAKEYVNNNLSIDKVTSFNIDFENYFSAITSFILQNNLTSEYVKNKKDELSALIENSDISTTTKEELKNNIKQIYSLTGIYELQEKLNYLEISVIVDAKQKLINKVNQANLSNQNKKDLTDLINTFGQNALNSFETEFDKFLEIWTNLNNKLNAIENYLNNDYQKSQKQVLDYYKEKAKYLKLFDKDDKLEKISLVSMNNNTTLFEEFLKVFETHEKILKNNTQTDSKTLLDYFKEETGGKLKFEFSELAAKYDLEKYSYSASYNFENTKLFFDVHDNEYVDYQITNLELDKTNWNNLLVEVTVTLKSKPEISYKYNFNKEYKKDVTAFINAINISNLDANFNVDYEALKELKSQDFLSYDKDKKLEYFRARSKYISKFFRYEFSNDFEFKDNKLYVTLKVLFNNQVIKEAKIATNKEVEFWNNEGNYQEYVDKLHESRILKIINGSSSDFFNSLKINHKSKNSHEVYLASDAIKAFNESYIMPKYGKYELFIKEVRDINDWDGSAKLVLWYKKDGTEVEKPASTNNKTVSISNFKLLNFFDLKPKGEVFTADDFKNSTAPTQNIINIINSVNESNFTLRLASSTNPAPDFRMLNVQDMIDQKAFVNMEYLMVFGNGSDNKGENHDNKAYVPLDNKYYDKNISVNSTDIKPLTDDFFAVYYDVKRTGKRGMTFKLGWINKKNQSIRYTNGKEYTLINLVNDYQQHHYPEIMVNNIKLSDLEINYEILKTKTADQWATDLESLNNVIKLKADSQNQINYLNYSLPVSSFKISAIRRISGDHAFVSFKIQGRNEQWINGNIWYKIQGFAPSKTNNIYQSFTWTNNNLKTIQDSSTSITRERVIEPMWDDLLWDLNQRTNIASWTFKRKYLEQTLLKPNARNREIKFKLLANVLINDKDKNNRLRDLSNGIDINVDLDNLIASKSKKFVYTTTVSEQESFKYVVSLTWNENTGIEFKIFMEDNSYKIIIDEPEVQNHFKTDFEKERAFIILPAAASITVKYTNDEEKEDFNVNQNRFDYNNMDYNQFNQPITFFSDAKYLANRDVYQPNQNVPYELHNGYKLDAEFMRLEEWRDWNVVDNAYLRAFQYSASTSGTGGFLAKTNDNPNDATFYYLTNMHVETQAARTFDDVIGENFLKDYVAKYYFLAYQLINTTLERNKQYTSTHYVAGNIPIKALWLAHSQESKDGKKTREPHDMILLSIDLNKELKNARNSGKMDIVSKIERIMKMPNISMDVPSKFRIVSVPMIWEAATLGFPHTKLSGSITRRPKNIQDNSYQTGWRDYYSHIYGGPGSSGSPVYVEKDGKLSYFGLMTAASSHTFGIGKNEYSIFYSYDLREYNLLGINPDNEHPLSLQNYKSAASQIFKAHLNSPDVYDMPWYLKQVKED